MRPRKIYNVILELARHKPQFTALDLTPLSKEQARRNSAKLVCCGELRLVKGGRNGRGGWPAVFAINGGNNSRAERRIK